MDKIPDYTIDGRPAALAFMRNWLEDNYPKPNIAYVNNITVVPKARRLEILNEKISNFAQRANINVAWRKSLANRLFLDDEEVVRATNTIIELMENTLAYGDTVRITNFGDIKPININEGKGVRFYADEDWIKEINDPIFAGEIGLHYKLEKKKLTRRPVRG